jgi:hypothetical protein
MAGPTDMLILSLGARCKCRHRVARQTLKLLEHIMSGQNIGRLPSSSSLVPAARIAPIVYVYNEYEELMVELVALQAKGSPDESVQAAIFYALVAELVLEGVRPTEAMLIVGEDSGFEWKLLAAEHRIISDIISSHESDPAAAFRANEQAGGLVEERAMIIGMVLGAYAKRAQVDYSPILKHLGTYLKVQL